MLLLKTMPMLVWIYNWAANIESKNYYEATPAQQNGTADIQALMLKKIAAVMLITANINAAACL